MTAPRIDKAEVLRYLGHRGQGYGPALDAVIDGAIAECHAGARPRHVWRLFELERTPEGIRLAGTDFVLPGGDIAAHLEGAQRCGLLAATLGAEVEARLRALSRTDMTAALALDAAATACIEAYCDDACAALAGEAAALGLYAGPRFSPGYGDLPLAIQPGLLRLLDAERRIGLTCTDSRILLPRKSVTAVAGLFEGPVPERGPACAGCNLRERCGFLRCPRGKSMESRGDTE